MIYQKGDLFIIKKAFTYANLAKIFNSSNDWEILRDMPRNKNLKKGKILKYENSFIKHKRIWTSQGIMNEDVPCIIVSGIFLRTRYGNEILKRESFYIPEKVMDLLLFYTGPVQLELDL